MKKVLLSIALAAVAPFAWGQVSETTTTTTTTEETGTITEFAPGTTIVLKESSGPKHYRFGKTVTYVTKSGKLLDEDTPNLVRMNCSALSGLLAEKLLAGSRRIKAHHCLDIALRQMLLVDRNHVV